jgi:hypothetical protein
MIPDDWDLSPGSVTVFVNVNEVPLARQVMSRLLGGEDHSIVGFPRYFDWSLGFDVSKAHTADLHPVRCDLHGTWQVKLILLSGVGRGHVSQQAAGSRRFAELTSLKKGLGIIGNAVCARLFNDFIDVREDARQLGVNFSEMYFNFARCFQMASQYRGIVIIQFA